MKVLKTLVAAAGLVFAAACSDTSNQMTGIDPTFSKVGKGGFGDPHFTDETVCTFNQETGRLACDYQIAGLSSNSSGLGLLIAKVPMSYYCNYPGISSDGFYDNHLLNVGFYWYSDKSGNAKGHVEGIPLGTPICLKQITSFPYILYGRLSDLQYHPLNNPAVQVQHLDEEAAGDLEVAEWALVAGVTTPKGGLRLVCDLGYWVPEIGLGVTEAQNE
jgi:hypothetical protein